MQKSPLVFNLLFSLGGFSCDHCSGWLFISRPLGSLSGCTWHSQGPLFYDPHLRLAQNIQHFAFPRFLPQKEGLCRFMLKCFMYIRHFFLLLTNHHHYEIMKDAEKGNGPGISTLWLCILFSQCLCSFSITESMNADNGKGA